MDIGVYMRPEVLAHKLAAQHERNHEQAWNISRWPRGLTGRGTDRLFVATKGFWRGYFVLASDALCTKDLSAFTLLFDAKTWTAIPPTHRSRFRGFTYRVPIADATSPAPDLERAHPSHGDRDHRH